MTEKPILFSGPMVRAILEGRKTMTRRVFQEQPDGNIVCGAVNVDGVWYWQNGFDGSLVGRCKLSYAIGDTLWVREAWAIQRDLGLPLTERQPVQYLADCANRLQIEDYSGKPSIHMPRWACRITLRVTGVKVERQQDISEEDAKAEGAQRLVMDDDGAFYLAETNGTFRCGFAGLWQHLNGPSSWDENPWVAAYTFEVVSVAGRGGQ